MQLTQKENTLDEQNVEEGNIVNNYLPYFLPIYSNLILSKPMIMKTPANPR